MLNPTIRKSLQKSLNRWLTSRAMITVDAITDTAEGGQTRTPILVAASVPCRKLIASQSDVSRAGLVGLQESLKDVLKIVFALGYFVPAIDQHITIDAETYEVIGLLTALTDEMFESAIVTRQR